MNFKKLIPLVFLIPVLALAGCEDEEPIDEILMNKIWQEAIVLNGINPRTPMPKVEFLKECPDIDKCKEEKIKDENLDNCPHKSSDILGVYYYRDSSIRICLNNIYDYDWSYDGYYKSLHIDFTYKEKRAVFYGVVAHEMLHHAIHLRGHRTKTHQITKDEKLLEKEMDLIADYYKLPKDGIPKELLLRSLEVGIKHDNEKNKTKSGMELKEYNPKNRYIECK